MLLMFEKGIRGEIKQAVKRYARASNKYMKDQYIPDEKNTYLQYLNADSFYGWEMIQKLPTDGFHGRKQKNFPRKKYKNHNKLPFLVVRMKIGKVEELVTNLKDKNKYVAEMYGTLNQALKHCLKLKKVHRVIRFEQSCWMKPHIMLNTILRMAARNEFEKDSFKLMNNSVFGKTMENIRNIRNMSSML